MTNEVQKNVKTLYGVYDTKLNEYVEVILEKSCKIQDVLKELACDIRSPYYQSCSDFDVYEIGCLDCENGILAQQHNKVGNLSFYVDKERVNFQRVVQVLNFLPNGYFKMPKEMQDTIKEQIADAIQEYVKNNITNEQLVQIKADLDKAESEAVNE